MGNPMPSRPAPIFANTRPFVTFCGTVSASALARLLSPATRLVSLACPSGVAIPRTVLAEVLSVIQARCPDALLLLDETYRCAVYGDDVLVPSAATMSPNVVVTGSLSKCHGVPGVRIGWAITRNARPFLE